MAIDVTIQDGSGSISTTVSGGADTRVIENTTSITSDYTAANFDVVLVDASGGGVTVTLPQPTTALHVIVLKTDSSSNAVTVATPDSETINGDSSRTLTGQYVSRTLVSDGTNFFIA